MDIALVKNHEIALVFLPAADIPTFVGEGRVDLGITGKDQVAEHEARHPATESTGVEEVLDLGFGKCKLQVQVPERSSSSDPRALIGKNVVTSFTALTEQYFRRLEDEQKTDGTNGDVPVKTTLKTNIIELGGSVEAACALGVGHGVVDLVGEFVTTAGFSEFPLMVGSRIWRNHESSWVESYRYRLREHSHSDQVKATF